MQHHTVRGAQGKPTCYTWQHGTLPSWGVATLPMVWHLAYGARRPSTLCTRFSWDYHEIYPLLRMDNKPAVWNLFSTKIVHGCTFQQISYSCSTSTMLINYTIQLPYVRQAIRDVTYLVHAKRDWFPLRALVIIIVRVVSPQVPIVFSLLCRQCNYDTNLSSYYYYHPRRGWK